MLPPPPGFHIVSFPPVVSKTDNELWDDWNELHCKYIQQGVEFRNSRMADYCEYMIIEGKSTYYIGVPVMSDLWFDRFEDTLKLLRPYSKVLIKVG